MRCVPPSQPVRFLAERLSSGTLNKTLLHRALVDSTLQRASNTRRSCTIAADQSAPRAALAVPAMTLVPIITLLFGYFPIALNLPTVLAITVYYIALHALTYYCKSAREFRALWLANIGTTIMFWPYAKAALQTPIKQLMGKGLTFKATSKGTRLRSPCLR